MCAARSLAFTSPMTTPTRCLAVLVWALAVALVGGQRCPDLEINLNVNEAVPTEVVNSSGTPGPLLFMTAVAKAPRLENTYCRYT